MSYTKWFDNHAKKHKKIVDRLQKLNFSDKEIVDYFDYDNMVLKEVEFCPLFVDGKKCHDMEGLNCYLCACPNFRFNDDGLYGDSELKTLSTCIEDNGEKLQTKRGVIHHDCSRCRVPHHSSFVLQNFSFDWKKIMHRCKVKID